MKKKIYKRKGIQKKRFPHPQIFPPTKKVKARSRQGQDNVRAGSGQGYQCMVINARSRQSQGKDKERSREGQSKFRVASRQGKVKVKVRSRQGQIRVKAM